MENKLDLLLTLASQYAGQPELELYENAGDELEPSKRFHRRMRRLVKQAKRQNDSKTGGTSVQLKRIAVAVMLICTVCLGAILCVDAVRDEIFKFVLRWDKQYVEFDFEPPDTVDKKNPPSYEIKEFKEPSAGLEGFERFEIGKNSLSFYIEYERLEDGVLICYSQSVVGAGTYYLSNNNTKYATVYVGKHSALMGEYETSAGYTMVTLLWNDGEYQYLLEGNTTLEHMLIIAQSIE